MDTGEGKTYAILPAAFALCCKYHRVYVICANDYLAERDAHRTRPLLDSFGVTLGLGMANGSEAWSKRVVYTTLRSLMFHHIFCEIAVRTQLAPISFGAAILDEADAILLDQSLTPYIHTANVPAKLHDWETTLALAGDLENEKDIIVDTDDFSASLTLEGEQKLKAMLGSPSAMSQRDLVMRDAVENAFIALFHVEEDRDYVVEGLRAYPIDRKTGEVHRGQTLGWIFPLEYRLGLPPRPGMVVLQSLRRPRVFLKGFAHISGLSGTIAPDAFEYIASYQLPCITIEPRRPRQDGMQDDIIFATREEAHDQVLEAVRTSGRGGTAGPGWRAIDQGRAGPARAHRAQHPESGLEASDCQERCRDRRCAEPCRTVQLCRRSHPAGGTWCRYSTERRGAPGRRHVHHWPGARGGCAPRPAVSRASRPAGRSLDGSVHLQPGRQNVQGLGRRSHEESARDLGSRARRDHRPPLDQCCDSSISRKDLRSRFPLAAIAGAAAENRGGVAAQYPRLVCLRAGLGAQP